jgi:hypothetical protein
MAIDEQTEVVGVAPRIGREAFARILREGGSPAADDAEAGWDIVAAQSVDPLFALAVFRQESRFGHLGVCVEFGTRSPGNTRTSRTGVGEQIQTSRGPFIRYPAWVEGWRDMAFRLVDPSFVYHLEGRRTIRQVIERYAPPDDNNDTEGYIAAVVAAMGAWADGGTTMPIVFGRVPHPPFVDRLIPDQSNRAWNALGQRTAKGVVYHRQQGPSNWGTDAYFRTPPPGGLGNCPPADQPPNFNWGGCNGLTDYGVDQHSGEILRWNDPLGQAHAGVSANRAGWASGPTNRQSANADGRAFLEDHGWDFNVVNRDQVSIEIAGFYGDPISAACKDAVAALSAHFADAFRIPWDSYPLVPGKAYNFTRWHNEFCGMEVKPCPGRVVMNETTDIINRTIAILKRFQVDERAPEFVAFAAVRIFHVPQNAIATARRAPNRGADQVRQFLPGAAIECDGFFRGESVEGEDRWLRTSDPDHLAIHVSGVVEPI